MADTVWEDLTVRDHLLFFARLKGDQQRTASLDSLAFAQFVASAMCLLNHFNHCLFASPAVAGVPMSKERALMQRAAENVELDGDAMMKVAKSLSGGMRRYSTSSAVLQLIRAALVASVRWFSDPIVSSLLHQFCFARILICAAPLSSILSLFSLQALVDWHFPDRQSANLAPRCEISPYPPAACFLCQISQGFAHFQLHFQLLQLS